MSRYQSALRAVDVTGPNLVALWAGQVIGDLVSIRTEAESIGQTFAQARELARVAAIHVDADNLPALVAHDLHEEPLVRDQERRSVKDGEAIPGGDLGQGIAVQVVDPEVGGGRVVIF